jgi:hypothetical protein
MMWVESVLVEMKAAGIVTVSETTEVGEESSLDAVAIDGKTLRGSKKQGAELSHLLSAVDHKTGMTLVQVPVDGKTNEIPLALVLLERIHLEGRVLTADALLTQRAIAEVIVQKGGLTSCP